MKATLTDIVMLFARARTAQQRTTALYQAVSCSRFDEDQVHELQSLLTEAKSNHDRLVPLRPVVMPTRDCPDLEELKPGDAPLLDDRLRETVNYWIAAWNRADELKLNGLTPPGPMLLHGPTGTGKTMLARSVVAHFKGRSAVVLDAHRCVDSHMGETGSRLAKAFAAAEAAGAFLVIEEIDAFAETRNGDGSASTRENNRITIALMRLIEATTVPLIATTNRPTVLDPALFRRFDVKLGFEPLCDDLRRAVLIKALHADPAVEATTDLLSALWEMSLGAALREIAHVKRRQYLAKNSAANDA